MKKNLSFHFAPTWGVFAIIVAGCILSCEENALTTNSLQQKSNREINTRELPIPGKEISVTTCANDRDRKTCDTDFNGYCECVGSNCFQYCNDELPVALLRLVERGRICGSTSGCLEPNIDKLILTFHIYELKQFFSVIRTEKNEIFAKGYLVGYDENTRFATVGYQMENGELAKKELFLQINTNFINSEGKFVSLALLSEAIPAGHFSK